MAPLFYNPKLLIMIGVITRNNIDITASRYPICLMLIFWLGDHVVKIQPTFINDGISGKIVKILKYNPI